jgi:hypothetical protein
LGTYANPIPRALKGRDMENVDASIARKQSAPRHAIERDVRPFQGKFVAGFSAPQGVACPEGVALGWHVRGPLGRNLGCSTLELAYENPSNISL